MTVKEKLYKEYVIAKNKLNALIGEEIIGGDNVEEYFTSYDFSNNASRHTKEQIKDMIAYAKRDYEDVVEEQRNNEFFNTEEGKEYKSNMTRLIQDGVNNRFNLVKSTTEKIDSLIKEWLGNDWGCSCIGTSSIEIGIVEKVAPNKANHFYFGHSFSLYYNDFTRRGMFNMNYGSMGSFGLLDGSEKNGLRCKFLIGMGKFVSDKDKVGELHSIIDEFCKKEYRISEGLGVLRRNLEHPFGNKNVA